MRNVGRPRLHPRDVGHVHDFPFGAPQVGDGALRDEKHRPQVQVERCVPALGGDGLDRFAHHDRGGVDHDVKAPQRPGRLIREPSCCCGVAEIGLEQLGTPTRAPHGSRGLLRPLCRAVVVNRDIAAGLRQSDGDRLADPLPSSRDERGCALEPH